MSERAPNFILEAQNISKAFPGCQANSGISLSIKAGEIHGLIGENGAGKSTLVKILNGNLIADEGELYWEGKSVQISSPSIARRLGIGMVFQHFSLFDAMTVSENIALGLDFRGLRSVLDKRIHNISKRYGLPVEATRYAHDLSVGEKQRIEIIRCLLQDPRLLIMDEPTSVLTPQEVDKLFVTLKRLRDEGRSILYISHKLEEIKKLCDRATILRGGRKVLECDPKKESTSSMAQMMIGSELTTPSRVDRSIEDKRPCLEISHLNKPATHQFGTELKNISFSVFRGEIVGIAGVAGNGQGELHSALSGEEPALLGESIRFNEMAVGLLDARKRREMGFASVPEERLGHGSAPPLSLVDNAILTGYNRMDLLGSGLIRQSDAEAYTEKICDQFDVRTTGINAPAASLSGGNLQKFIVGREILQQPDLIIVAHPTWGVDAGAAATIHRALINMAAEGSAVLVISQDLDELLSISHRLGVLNNGQLSTVKTTTEYTLEEIGLLMGGLHEQGVEANAV